MTGVATRAGGHALQLLFYYGIGGAGAVGYAVLSTVLTSHFGFRPSAASLTGYAAMIPPIYVAQKMLTFRSTARHAAAFPKYVAVQAIGSVIALTLSELLIAGFGFPPLVSFGAVALVIASTNFVMLRWWAFANR